MNKIEEAKERFGRLVETQLARVETLKRNRSFTDYKRLDKIVIGIAGGDGIGPAITAQAGRVLEVLLKEEISSGKIELRAIDGLTLENRIACLKPIPDDVMEALRACDVILKGPTTTPSASDGLPNIESANVAMRKALDLFANVRPVKIPAEGIDWVFFRENTEGGYALGSEGIEIDGDLAFDFTVATTQGCERVIRAAFEYALNNGGTRVTAVTKGNIIKTTDGKFLKIFRRVAEEYPGIQADDWFIDIMAAKLIDPKRRRDFQVMVLPNLYGDILTDEAAELQGGVGTAGSANIGYSHGMFEAIHGSAPRMVREGRERYADPSSMIRASIMLLEHIGFGRHAQKLDTALLALLASKKAVITGRPDGATCAQFAAQLIRTI
ncbi:MAG: isocitrate/isopropylmalate dehydrogenase family protein [Clostridiales bacterium]|jgi:isocitrate dehydrogenase (NAD+)|nr:isocitrate/isopropylmalate dehydrogenase family protein [Clostridiales bacterium]